MVECFNIDSCKRNLEETSNYMDGYGCVYICANCKRYYVKLKTQIVEVEFANNEWKIK